MKKGRILVGLFLIALGFLFLLNYASSYYFLTSANTWPFYLLILGLGFELNFFLTSKNSWSLIPGGVLLATGVIMLLQVFLNHWHYARYTWPIYILIPLAGLWQFYYFSGKKRSLLIPIYVLSSLTAITAIFSVLAFAFQTQLLSMVIAIAFILAGGFILLKKQDSNKTQS